VSRLRKQVRSGAARKGSPSRHGRKFKVGGRVRIIEIPEDLKSPDYDSKHDTEEPKFRTAELFRFCIGREFTVQGFGRYGHVELDVSDDDPGVRKKFGKSHTIWIEPEFLEQVSTRKKMQRGK